MILTDMELVALLQPGARGAKWLDDAETGIGELLELRRHARKLRTAAMLVLLFHSGSPWDVRKSGLWKGITGSDDASTKVLCDHIRAVLDEVPFEETEGVTK